MYLFNKMVGTLMEFPELNQYLLITIILSSVAIFFWFQLAK